MNHSRWHRFLIAIAGPAMNILLAIFLLTTVYMVHYEYPVYLDKPAVIDGVRAGLCRRRRLDCRSATASYRVDDIENPTWEQLQPRGMAEPESAADGHDSAWESDIRQDHSCRSR